MSKKRFGMGSAVKVLTVNEVAEYLQVAPITIYRLLQQRRLPGFKVGHDWRFKVDAIDRWRFEQ